MVSRKCKITENRFGNTSLDFIPSQAILRDKGCHFTVPSKDRAVMKIYVRNRTTSKYITLEMVEIKGEVYRNMFILGENETVLSTSAGGRDWKQ